MQQHPCRSVILIKLYTKSAVTCPMFTTEHQSKVLSVFKVNNKDTTTTPLLTLNIFHTQLQCFYSQLLAGKCRLGSNVIAITLPHGCSSVNLLHIRKTTFQKNTSGRELLILSNKLGAKQDRFFLSIQVCPLSGQQILKS